MYVCMYVCMHVCMYVCIYVCVCMYICMCIYIYIYIYIYPDSKRPPYIVTQRCYEETKRLVCLNSIVEVIITFLGTPLVPLQKNI